MKTSNIKNTEQKDQQPVKSKTTSVKASVKNATNAAPADSSNKGKGPRGENL